jgi:NTP pyrophosphatase (non-canonical NTP hydrolase)
MNFDDYQKLAISTAIYPEEYKIIYPALGLCGESGEVAEKIKKHIRDGKSLNGLKKELGDVLWYIAALAEDLDISLQDVAELNIQKLSDRKERNVISGDGDNR